jgi:hypothetical protein
MYGLQIGVDLSFFVGTALSQVCIGANELILNFDSDISVTVESRIALTSPGTATEQFDNLRASAALLVGLLELQVATVEARPEGTLRLQFKTGHILDLYDTSETYESYQIRHGSDVIVV